MTLCWVDPYCGKKPGVNNYFLPKKLTPDLYSETGKTDSSILRHFTHEGFAREQAGSKQWRKPSEPIHLRVCSKKGRQRRIIRLPQLIAWLGQNKWRGRDKLSLKNFPVFHCNNRDPDITLILSPSCLKTWEVDNKKLPGVCCVWEKKGWTWWKIDCFCIQRRCRTQDSKESKKGVWQFQIWFFNKMMLLNAQACFTRSCTADNFHEDQQTNMETLTSSDES